MSRERFVQHCQYVASVLRTGLFHTQIQVPAINDFLCDIFCPGHKIFALRDTLATRFSQGGVQKHRYRRTQISCTCSSSGPHSSSSISRSFFWYWQASSTFQLPTEELMTPSTRRRCPYLVEKVKVFLNTRWLFPTEWGFLGHFFRADTRFSQSGTPRTLAISPGRTKIYYTTHLYSRKGANSSGERPTGDTLAPPPHLMCCVRLSRSRNLCNESPCSLS